MISSREEVIIFRTANGFLSKCLGASTVTIKKKQAFVFLLKQQGSKFDSLLEDVGLRCCQHL